MERIINRLKHATPWATNTLNQDLEQLEDLNIKIQQTLRNCKAQVGMVTGEEITALLAEMNGEAFSETDYNHERLPEGQ